MEIKILKIQIQKIKIGEMVHFEVTDVIRTFKYCNFSSYRVFKLDLSETKHLLGHQKCTFKS